MLVASSKIKTTLGEIRLFYCKHLLQIWPWMPKKFRRSYIVEKSATQNSQNRAFLISVLPLINLIADQKNTTHQVSHHYTINHHTSIHQHWFNKITLNPTSPNAILLPLYILLNLCLVLLRSKVNSTYISYYSCNCTRL